MSTQQAVYHDIWCATLFGCSKCNCIADGSFTPEFPIECGVRVHIDGGYCGPCSYETGECPDHDKPTHIREIIPKVMKEIAPMAASLPSIDTQPLVKKYEPTLSGLSARIVALDERSKRLGVTLQIANEAQEIDTEAKRYLEMIEAETAPTRSALFTAHRNFTAFCAKLMDGPTKTRAIARRLIGAYNAEQQRKADEARREAQRLAQEQADRDQRAKADALLAEAAQLEASGQAETAAFVLQEAEDAAQAPAIPVAVPEVAPQKVDGSSVSYKLVGTVRDPIAYLTYLLSKPELIAEVVAWSQSGLNAQLKRGLKLADHGVHVERKPIVSNRAR